MELIIVKPIKAEPAFIGKFVYFLSKKQLTILPASTETCLKWTYLWFFAIKFYCPLFSKAFVNGTSL